MKIIKFLRISNRCEKVDKLTIFQRSYAVFKTFIPWITHCQAWIMSRLRGFCCPLSKWLSLWANIAKSKDLTTSIGLRPKYIWALQKFYSSPSYLGIESFLSKISLFSISISTLWPASTSSGFLLLGLLFCLYNHGTLLAVNWDLTLLPSSNIDGKPNKLLSLVSHQKKVEKGKLE